MTRIATLLAAAAATAAFAGATTASAVVYTFSPYNITSSTDTTVSTLGDVNSTKSSETFIDDFNFGVTGSDLSDFTTASTFSKKNGDAVTSISVALYEGTPTASGHTAGEIALTPSAIYTQPGSAPTYEYTLDAGAYFVETTTVVPAGKTGLFTVTASGSPISAAPEPGTWALMFAGVGIAGAALRMGRRSGAVAAA